MATSKKPPQGGTRAALRFASALMLVLALLVTVVLEVPLLILGAVLAGGALLCFIVSFFVRR